MLLYLRKKTYRNFQAKQKRTIFAVQNQNHSYYSIAKYIKK